MTSYLMLGLSDAITLTDFERWFPDTDKLWSQMLEAGFEPVGLLATSPDTSFVASYNVRHEYGGYHWEGQDQPGDLVNDTLDGVEEFDFRQRVVPVAIKKPFVRFSDRELARQACEMVGLTHEHTLATAAEYARTELPLGAPMTALQVAAYVLAYIMDPRADEYRERAARERQGYYDAVSLQRQINAPPSTFRGSIALIEQMMGGNLLRGAPVRVMEIISPQGEDRFFEFDPSARDGYYIPVGELGPAQGFTYVGDPNFGRNVRGRSKIRHERSELHAARPKKRLDGRRG